MPRVGITAYDLLLSCPGDVLDTIDIIKQEVENFNRIFGSLNNIEVIVRHWSTDSFPQSGDKPQELLNKQFVRDCDAAVAIFWTRFGTPTDKYQSGTEEEIEEMIRAGKQVFLYFLDKPISPSGVDMKQYDKVKQFKERYKDRGIFAVINDEQDLRKQFLNHLSLYFLKLFTGKQQTNIVNQSPQLMLKCLDQRDKKINVTYRNLKQSKFIKNKEESIVGLINKINEINLPKRSKVEHLSEEKRENNSGEKNEILSSIQDQLKLATPSWRNSLSKSEYIDIDHEQKNQIHKYCSEREIIILDEFWNLGNLKKQEALVQIHFSSGTSLIGTNEEKQKYELIQDLYWEIEEYHEYEDYFTKIDKMGMVKCIISNNGTTFDEDIDVKITIRKGCILQREEIPIPDINIIDKINETKFIKVIFRMQDNDSIEAYSDYPVKPHIKYPSMPDPFWDQRKSSIQKYEDSKREYGYYIDEVFCYKYYSNDENDIITFNIRYLKQNTNMYLPSLLIFKQIPEYFEYEIRSKYTPDVVRGRVELQKEVE